MCRGRIIIVLLGWMTVNVWTLAAHAQGGADKAYLPLAVGNDWTYYHLREHPDGSIDTLIHNPVSITEAIDLAGKTYYRYPLRDFFGIDTLRTDDAGRIFGLENGADILLLDFTLPDSATYVFDGSYDPTFPYLVTVRRGVTVDILGGRFLDCIEFNFDIPEAVDDEASFTFYPGVGLVRHIDGMGVPTFLFEAVVDGQIVTAIENESPNPRSITLDVPFPNPFSETTTLQFKTERPGQAILTVYDLLGREVATVLDGFVSAGQHRILWDAHGQPAGYYLARLQMDEAARSIPLVLVR